MANRPDASLTSILQDIAKCCSQISVHKGKATRLGNKCTELLAVLPDLTVQIDGSELKQVVDEVLAILQRIQKRVESWSLYSRVKSFTLNTDIEKGLDQCESDLDTAQSLLQINAHARVKKMQRKATEMQPDESAEILELLLQISASQDDTQQPGGTQEVGENEADPFKADSEHSAIPPSVKILNGDVTRIRDSPVASGGYSDVWLGMWLGSTKVALKASRTSRDSARKAQRHFVRELKIWVDLNHSNILPFYGIVTDLGQDIHMVSPWQENGNALEYTKSHPEANRIHLLFGAAQGLEYLHNNKIIHGDVKCTNILVSEGQEAYICDFGLSRSIDDTDDVEDFESGNHGGTLRWQAPELIQEITPNPTMPSDIYSYGMTILELLTGKPPFSHHSRDASVIHDVILGKRPLKPTENSVQKWLSDDLWVVVQRCWDQTADARPTMVNIVTKIAEIEGQLSLPNLIDGEIAFGLSTRNQKENLPPLHYAVLQGNISTVKSLLETEVDINAIATNGCTPLHFAAYKGYADLAILLVHKQANVNICDHYGLTPLHIFLRKNTTELVALVINIVDYNGQTPLYSAIERREFEFVKLLLKNQADVNFADKDGWTPLHLAAGNGYPELVQELIDNHADVNKSNNDSLTPLHIAVTEGNIEVVKLLIQHQADVNKPGIHGWRPLHFACDNNNIQLVKILIDKQASPDASDENGQTPLHFSVNSDNTDITILLLKSQANSFLINMEGQTALDLAIKKDSSGLIKLLIDITDLNGQTPLHTAVKSNSVDFVRLLLRHNANANIIDNQGQTPLHFAMEQRNSILMQLLAEHQAHANIADSRGSTPLHVAAKGGSLDLIRSFLQNFAQVNAADDKGHTALHLAAKVGMASMIKLLVDNHADVNICDKKGYTALHWVAKSEYPVLEKFKILLSAGANINVVDQHNCTPLHLIVNEGWQHLSYNNWSLGNYQELTETVKYFLTKNASYNIANDKGFLPLHIAVKGGQTHVVKLLLDDAAELSLTNQSFMSDIINAKDLRGKTPLHYATCKESASLLLDSGAAINAIDKDSHTPLYYAQQQGYYELMEFFEHRLRVVTMLEYFSQNGFDLD